MEHILLASIVRIFSAETLEDTYRTILKEAITLLKAKYGSIFLPHRGGLVRKYYNSPHLRKVKIHRKGNTYNGFITAKGLLLKKSEVVKIHPEYDELMAGDDLTVPLNFQDMTIGVLSVQAPPDRKFTKKHLDLLLDFSNISTISVSKLQYEQQLIKAIEDRDLFVSIASHELKTPLTSAKAYQQLMARSIDKKKQPKVSDMVDKVGASLDRMSFFVDDFLHPKHISNGALKYKMDKVNLVEIIQEAVHQFSISHSHKIKLDLKDTSAHTRGDAVKLTQVISNLLNNAAKFSKPDTSITIKLEIERPNIKISITDQGQGMNPETVKKIFERFYKSETSKGMGLGLYLVKTILDRHHGSIDVNSIINEGTTFVIWLPYLNIDEK